MGFLSIRGFVLRFRSGGLAIPRALAEWAWQGYQSMGDGMRQLFKEFQIPDVCAY
jgi:hypothetical protein